jgi:ABC-2 type transport system permease protein
MPLTAVKAAEAYAVALTFSLYLLGAGNVSSVYYPRAINPERSTGAASAGRLRAMLLLIYPAAAIPILLAYGARYAFTSDTAFWSVIAIAAALGAAFYWVALDSALERIERNKDRILRTLSEDEGPVRLS